LKHEVVGETLDVSADRFVQVASGHVVQGGQLSVPNDPVPAEHQDRALNTLDGK
jgi:hypothetical protein